MGKLTVTKGEIDGLLILEPAVYGDERGYFMESYNKRDFKEAGIDNVFVQDNQSLSKKGVLRGLHYQINYPQSKLVRVLRGEIYDVAVDMRKGSPTFGQWHGVYLSDTNQKQFFLPKGFAHGFLVLSDEAVFLYKCDDYYHPEDEAGIIWNDKVLGVVWPIERVGKITISEKDGKLPVFANAVR